MLLTCADRSIYPQWIALAREMEPIFRGRMADNPEFRGFMDRAIETHSVYAAVKRFAMPGKDLMGVVVISREKNAVGWLGVFERFRRQGAGSALLEVALRQLNPRRKVSVITFRSDDAAGAPARRLYHRMGFIDVDDSMIHHGQPRCLMERPAEPEKSTGGSFHFDYDLFARRSEPAGCPICLQEPEPPNFVTITEMPYAMVGASPFAQGRLWGKCHVVCREHYVELHDLSRETLIGYMTDLQGVSRALKRVSGAAKINCEFHGNTIPHLHAHLFPRYLDDAFPSAPIDYRITKPFPYDSLGEFELFVTAMREELKEF